MKRDWPGVYFGAAFGAGVSMLAFHWLEAEPSRIGLAAGVFLTVGSWLLLKPRETEGDA